MTYKQYSDLKMHYESVVNCQVILAVCMIYMKPLSFSPTIYAFTRWVWGGMPLSGQCFYPFRPGIPFVSSAPLEAKHLYSLFNITPSYIHYQQGCRTGL